jgi:hypothetical protein
VSAGREKARDTTFDVRLTIALQVLVGDFWVVEAPRLGTLRPSRGLVRSCEAAGARLADAEWQSARCVVPQGWRS